MPSQRQYFLSSFFAAFRPQPSIQQQQNKQASSSAVGANQSASSASTANNNNSSSGSTPSRSLTSAATTAAAGPRTIAAAAAAARNNAVTIHSPRAGIPIPHNHNRRRGSDSSSEGFRDAIGAEKWYIGGKGVTGDETFFKLGVVRRVKSNDGLSLDRLSL